MSRYWGQISAAFLLAGIAVFLLDEQGVVIGTAVGLGVLAYVTTRWTIAWLFRTRYWLNKPGYGNRSCPHCTQYIYRISGDWILECKRCGWRAGWPVLRWITHSVPSVQFRRTVAGPTFLVFVFVGLLVASGASNAFTTSAIEDSWPDQPIFTGDGEENQPTAGPSKRSAETDDSIKDTPRRELSPGTVEQTVHQYVNEERSRRGLSKLTYDEQLAEIARYHSEDMSENGYFSHDSPGGESMSDRYDRFGYDCRVPAGENTYLTGAENIAFTYFEERIIGGEYHDSPGDVGQGIVDGWMNSQGHRENILTAEWRTEGIGVAITETSEGTRVYVTQNFC